jgi:hypothetical protein
MADKHNFLPPYDGTPTESGYVSVLPLKTGDEFVDQFLGPVVDHFPARPEQPMRRLAPQALRAATTAVMQTVHLPVSFGEK